MTNQSTVSQAEFERCAIAAGLLTQEQLDEAHAVLIVGKNTENHVKNEADPQPLASQLIQAGLLNAWQASQLLEGRARFSLGKYRIIDSLGRGGMGQVFLANVGNSTQTVAVKVLPQDKATPMAVEAFRREIGAQSGLNHQNLVRALDAGFDGNVYYLVSEYVPGKNLRQLIRQDGPLPVDKAAWIIAQAAAGLEHAHQNGWIHRDVKPGNILVMPDGNAKLSDLGLAGPLAEKNKEGAVDACYNQIAGTVDYLCPDQIRNPREPTPAWDVYSLGCTLYYAITGKVPFPGGTAAEKAKAHCEQMPLDPRRFIANLPDEFVDLLIAMLAKEPQNRLATARAAIERLRPFFTSPQAVTPPQSLNPAFELDLSLPTAIENAAEPKTSPIVPLLALVVLPTVVAMLFSLFYLLMK